MIAAGTCGSRGQLDGLSADYFDEWHIVRVDVGSADYDLVGAYVRVEYGRVKAGCGEADACKDDAGDDEASRRRDACFLEVGHSFNTFMRGEGTLGGVTVRSNGDNSANTVPNEVI